MPTSTTSSETRDDEHKPGLQDLPAEMLTKISNELDWVSRARCQMLCKALYQNMSNPAKDEEEALDFYYRVLHAPEYESRRRLHGYPEQWAQHHKKKSVYTVMLHKKRARDGRSYYPSIVTTVFYPKHKKLSGMEVQYLFNRHFLDMTKEDIGLREIVVGSTQDIIDRFYIEDHSAKEKEICITFYKLYTDTLLTLDFLKHLRSLLYKKIIV